ncbi:hypothetical protein EDF62_3372 [Leucobacter luti]|uniref:ABC-2 type transport system permease protein n=1 Tax=Leucobacter luti TaxID=340320 RepID=A0A4R6RR47_9MICO|nr:hypothetical protein [Leucobacter luti]TDP89289.1 hypothetical protein EDF62_3372 [Leucobacter luti]
MSEAKTAVRTAERAVIRGPVARLRAVRLVRRGRGDRLSAGDVSYRIYLAVMLGIIVVAPLVRSSVLAAAPVLPSIGRDSAPLLAAGMTLLCAGAALLGSKGGPARAGLPQLDLLFTAAIPRWLLLLGTVARWYGSAALGGAVLGGMCAVALALGLADTPSAQISLGAGFALLGAGACLGVLMSGAQLLGQVGIRVRTCVALSLVALAAVQLAWGAGQSARTLWDPWSAAAQIWGHATDGSAPVPVQLWILGGSAAIVLLCALPLASRLDRDGLRAQAATWDSAKTFAVTGDPTAALARFGTPVRVGRSLMLKLGAEPARDVDTRAGSKPAPPGLWAALVKRDLLGILRTPARSLAALLGIVTAGLIWASLFVEPRDMLSSALLGAVVVLGTTLSLPAWCRGIATSAAGAGSPSLFPIAPGGLILRHTIAPLLLAVAALGAGAAVAAAVWPGEAAWSASATVPLIAVVAVMLRVAAALKGTIPLRLLAPVPTPAGDMSGLNVFIWSLDGPVIAVLAGAALGALWGGAGAGGGVVAPILLSAALLAVLGGWAYSRLRPSLSAQITEE